jgi:hypothetical protein
MTREPITFMVQGFDSRVKTVTAGSKTSLRAYAPVSWGVGKRVMIILLDQPDDDPDVVEE